MRILFACHRLPFPPKRGGKIRPFNIIKHFSELGHKVTVATLARSGEELSEGRGLDRYCEQVLVGTANRVSSTVQMVARLASTTPSSMGYFYSSSLHRRVRKVLVQNEFDLAFVHCSSAAQYVRHAAGIPSILDFGDMDSQKWLDYARFKPFPLAAGYWLEGKKLAKAERSLGSRFDVCTCTTRAELASLDAMGTARQTAWFPNGVDAEYFAPASSQYNKNEICFIGRMDYFPNQQAMLSFCSSEWPVISARVPKATLTIVGADPSPAIKNLARLSGVTVTGTVDDVRPFVRRACVTVAPLTIARGTQNKILESMAMGTPVVTTPIAAGGVDAEKNSHFVVSERGNDFAENVISLMSDPAERGRLSEAGRQRILEQHNWAKSMVRLNSIVESATGEPFQ